MATAAFTAPHAAPIASKTIHVEIHRLSLIHISEFQSPRLSPPKPEEEEATEHHSERTNASETSNHHILEAINCDMSASTVPKPITDTLLSGGNTS